jgi:hypothetical protein
MITIDPIKKAAADQSKANAAQDQLLRAYTQVELDNITPSGAIRMTQWLQAGNAKAAANAAWLEAHWAEFYAKQTALAAGEAVDFTPTSAWKPWSFSAIAAEMA